jgi:hypothetical protein
MNDDIVFGDALFEAAGMDRSGGPPRLALRDEHRSVATARRQFFDLTGFMPEESSFYDRLTPVFADLTWQQFLRVLASANGVQRRRVAKALGVHVRDVRVVDASVVTLPARAKPVTPATSGRHVESRENAYTLGWRGLLRGWASGLAPAEQPPAHARTARGMCGARPANPSHGRGPDPIRSRSPTASRALACASAARGVSTGRARGCPLPEPPSREREAARVPWSVVPSSGSAGSGRVTGDDIGSSSARSDRSSTFHPTREAAGRDSSRARSRPRETP